MARRGGFGVSLDPFGGAMGGLGRYNVGGDSVSSVADFERYATGVAWGNGEASDAEMLAAIQAFLALAPPGSRDQVSGMNQLLDTQYQIERNKLVQQINDSVTHAGRQAALSNLLAFEQAQLAGMGAPDSQAYREKAADIAALRGEIRKDRYSELVEKVNLGQASTARLLELARTLAAEAAGDPDVDDWGTTVLDLVQRETDEKISQAYQDYQMNRLSGDALLAMLDEQLATYDPESPAYKELLRNREDLAVRVKNEKGALTDAQIQAARNAGTLSDEGYLAYLTRLRNDAVPGTADWVNAGARLSEYTFSLAEDKLRFDVTKGRKPVSALIAFYEGYRKTMDPGSERWRSLTLEIESLKKRLVSAGPGGPKLLGKGVIDGAAVLRDILGGAKPPPAFDKLFQINPTDNATRAWWNNNLQEIRRAGESGSATWTYIDTKGNRYELPFRAGMLEEADRLNVEYMQVGLASADNFKEWQTWGGRVSDAVNQLKTNASATTLDTFSSTMAAFDDQKRRLLAGGHLAEYYNVWQMQMDVAKAILADKGWSLSGGPDGQLATVNGYIRGIIPQETNEALDSHNPGGDPILAMFNNDGGVIRYETDDTGRIVSAQVDPDKGYYWQDPATGRITIEAIDFSDPNATRVDPENGQIVPAYFTDRVQVTTTTAFGEKVQVWQEIRRPGDQPNMSGTSVPVYTTSPRTGVAQAGSRFAGTPTKPGGVLPIAAIDPLTGHPATLPLFATSTTEWPNGKPVTVWWVSTSDPANGAGGETWVRLPAAGEAGVMPRLVLPPSITIGDDGKWKQGGKDLAPEQVLAQATFWTGSDGFGQNGTSFGAPGAHIVHRTGDAFGVLDLRGQAVIFREEAYGYQIGKKSGELERDDLPLSFVVKPSPEMYEPPSRLSPKTRDYEPPSRLARPGLPAGGAAPLSPFQRGETQYDDFYRSGTVHDPKDRAAPPPRFGRGPLEFAEGGTITVAPTPSRAITALAPTYAGAPVQLSAKPVALVKGKPTTLTPIDVSKLQLPVGRGELEGSGDYVTPPKISASGTSTTVHAKGRGELEGAR